MAAVFIVVAAAIAGTAIAGYTTYTPITNVSITSHNDYDSVYVGQEYTLTSTTSTDKDCHNGSHTHSDPIVHTWSGPGTFDPQTGTTVTWIPPRTSGNVTITVTASDNGSPVYANDTDKSDSVILTVENNLYYVDADANGNDDGTSWTDAFNYLQDALDAVSSGDEIWVADGNYYPDEGNSVTDNDRSETFQLVGSVGVYGGFDATETARSERDWATNETILSGDIDGDGIVDGDNSYHVTKGADNAVLDGFTITKGYANGSGTDHAGAGMLNYYTSPIVKNCHFTDNATYSEGSSGAGMCNSNSTGTITDCLFTNNRAGGDPPPTSNIGLGGAISNFVLDVVIRNCIFYDNFASYGGAIENSVCDTTIENCVFVANEAAEHAGAIDSGWGAPTITNCVFVDNSARSVGAMYIGLYCDTIVTNCIFWGNTGGSCGEIYNRIEENDPNFSYCDIDGGINGSKFCGYDVTDGGGNINSDPDFVDDTDPDGDDDIWMTSDDGLALDSSAGSPCIDAANGNVDPTTDILGNSRYDDPNTTNTGIGDPNYVDMGPYEYQGS
jgi:hypothetical protein